MIEYLSLSGLVRDALLAPVNADIFEFVFRPTNRSSVQFFESSLLHSVANDGYPCRVPALTRFRTGFRALRSVCGEPVTSWNLAIEKMRFWYESSA